MTGERIELGRTRAYIDPRRGDDEMDLGVADPVPGPVDAHRGPLDLLQAQDAAVETPCRLEVADREGCVVQLLGDQDGPPQAGI